MSTLEPVIPADETIAKDEAELDVFSEEKVDGLEVTDDDPESGQPMPVYGGLLDASWYYEFKSRQNTDIIYILGESDSGKTTFEAMIYGLLYDHVDESMLFAGSKTLMAFEARRRYIVSSDEEPRYYIEMERTRRDGSSRIFLHLDLYMSQCNEKKTILLPDVPGEDYVGCSQEKEQISKKLPLIEYASHIVILLDAEKLKEVDERDSVFMRARYFLQMLRASHKFRNDAIIDIVVSKCDILAGVDGGKELVQSIPREFVEYAGDFTLKYSCIEAQNGVEPEYDSSEDVITFFQYLVRDLENSECVTVNYDNLEKGMADNCNLLRRRWSNE